MKKITTIAAGAALALLVFAAGTPAQAACGNAYAIAALDNVAIEGALFPYAYSAIPMNTPNGTVDFWSVTSGDPAIGAGDDNGAFDPGLGGFGAVDFYGSNYNYTTYISTNWAANATIDGCIDSQGLPDARITCVMVNDSFEDVGYWAIMGDQADAGGNFNFGTGPFTLVPVPKSPLVSTAKNGTGVDVSLNSPPVVGGVYGPNGNDCAPAGYKVYALEVMEGGLPPAGRSRSSWTPLSATVPIGTPTTVTAACDSFPAVDLYVTSTLVFPSGFETNDVSANSVRISCGVAPTLAEPLDRPRVKPNQPLTPRDNNRGDRKGR